MNPIIIFDASTLISFSMAGLLPEIKELKKIFKGKFIISQAVKEEAIDRPMKIQRFQLEAIKIKALLDEKILELPIALGLDDKVIREKTNEIAIDERTTRSLSETPNELKKYLESKLHAKMTIKQEKVDFFKQFRFIRSTELIYVAYKKGLLRLKGTENLSAVLYALKYKGCAISGREIQEIKNLG